MFAAVFFIDETTFSAEEMDAAAPSVITSASLWRLWRGSRCLGLDCARLISQLAKKKKKKKAGLVGNFASCANSNITLNQGTTELNC